jgi:membrane protease YdiL (CAAX protease family)
MKHKNNKFVLKSTLLYILPSIIIGAIAEMIFSNSLITTFAIEVSFIISLIIIRRNFISVFPLQLNNSKFRVAPAVFISLTSIFYTLFLTAIMTLIFPVVITPNNFNTEFFIGISFTFLLNPIIEEIIFRKYICTALSFNNSFKKTVILSSLIFTVVHFGDPFSMLQIFIGSVFMSYLFLKTKKLIYPVLFHILHNSTYGLVTLGNDVDFISSKLFLVGTLLFTELFMILSIITLKNYYVNENNADLDNH